MRVLKISAMAVLCCAAASASAQYYVSAGVSQGRVQASAGTQNQTGLNLKLGYTLNESVSIESGYAYVGKKANETLTVTPIQIVAGMPVAEGLSAHVKGGYALARFEAADGSARRVGKPTWGVGAKYAINRQADARVDFDQYRYEIGASGKSAKANVVSAGVDYRFD